MTRKCILLMAVLALAACDREPERVEKTASGRQVELVTEHDGVRLWAVNYGGNMVYFTSKGGTQHSVSCGKGCTRAVIVSPTPAQE